MIRLDLLARLKTLSEKAYPLYKKDCVQTKHRKMNQREVRFRRLVEEFDGTDEKWQVDKINEMETGIKLEELLYQ